MVTKAVIPAAGLGTRLRPMTRVVAKELFPVLDTPLIHLIVEEAITSGITEICIVISEEKSSLKDYFDANIEAGSEIVGKAARYSITELAKLATIEFVTQPRPLGLGHAVSMAADLIGNSSFAVLLGDNLTVARTPVTRQLVEVHNESGGLVLGAQYVDKTEVNRYGIIETESPRRNVYPVTNVIEKPQPQQTRSRVAIAGRYIFPAGLFSVLERTDVGKNGEIQLTDAIGELLQHQPGHACVYEGERLDLGCPDDFIRANILAAINQPEYRDTVTKVLGDMAQGRVEK